MLEAVADATGADFSPGRGTPYVLMHFAFTSRDYPAAYPAMGVAVSAWLPDACITQVVDPHARRSDPAAQSKSLGIAEPRSPKPL